MPSLLKILAVKNKDVKTGTVISRLPGGYYHISTGGRTIKVKSAMSGTLPIGAGVVMASTDDGLFIVGKEKIKSRYQKEVIING